MEQIILWESDGETIRACELAVYKALKELGLKATVTVNSEPPLIGRNQLWGRLPVLEIQGQWWSFHPGRAFTAEQVTRLFMGIFLDRISPCSVPDEDAGQKDVPMQTAEKGETNGN